MPANSSRRAGIQKAKMPHHLLRIKAYPFVLPLCAIAFALLIAQTLNAQTEDLPDAPSAVVAGQFGAAKKTAATAPAQTSQNVDWDWPREADLGEEKLLMYQPQVEGWHDDQIKLYAALSVENKSDHKLNYGVVWFTGNTEVDKVNRRVTLDNFQITKLTFPALESKQSGYEQFLTSRLKGKSKVVALDRLEAAMAASEAEDSEVKGLPVKNDPPRVIFATKPSMLVVIDGPPQYREIGGTSLQKVLNSQAFILHDAAKTKYYLNVMDGWLEAPALDGPWTYLSKIPDDMKEITKGIQERQQQKTEEGSTPPSLKQAHKEGKVPVIYVTTAPTELLMTEGAPQFEMIPESNLQYVKNTTANIFQDPATSSYYILLAGRWFQSKSLENGPWSFVNGKDLPAGFAKIPENSPKAGVLASVPGTAPAEEALIANSIPQTATITRSEAHCEVKYDGTPQFKELEGTQLQYATNTASPVIRVDDHSFYVVENAVWFVGPSPTGPWEVATSVPDVIYTIPPSSSLHYVTYVKVYRSTPEVVYVGYTPGYYGTVVSSTTTTVVYGTGYYYPPYIGSYWYGAPYTYGVGVATTWTSGTGWSLTVGVGYTYGYPYYPYYYPWWGPWGYYGACCWGPAWGYGYGGFASTNVYGRWGNTAYQRTQAAWANPYTGNYGAASRTGFQNTQRGTVGVAGRGTNTNIYTGNTVGGRGAVAYDPKTGIVAGGGAGYAGNIYSGEGAAGRGGFAYNTNTGAGIAAGGNNVYAGKDGNVYRYDRQSGNWSQNSGNGWQSVDKPQPSLQRQQQARSQGQQRTQNFSGTMNRGSFGGGGFRGGGRRR
jgi:hypothetical protein